MGVADDVMAQLFAERQADTADAASGKSSTRRELEAAVRDQIGSGAAAVGALTGSQGAKDFADEQTKTSARLRRPGLDTYVQSLDDIHGVGDAASYAARAAINLAPTLATMAIGGGVGGAIAKGGLTAEEALAAAPTIARARAAGSIVPTELPSIGQEVQAQQAEGGENVPAAVALGTASNLLNLGGVGGIAAGRGLPANLARSARARIVTGAGVGALEQGAISVAQQGTEELARKSVNEQYDMTNPDAQKRLIEAGVSGLAVGGLAGGAHGAVSRAKDAPIPVDNADPKDLTQPAADTTQPPATADTTKPTVEAEDPLVTLQKMAPVAPKLPKIDDVRDAINPKGDRLGRNLVTDLHGALTADDPNAIGKVMTDFAARVEANATDTNIKPATLKARQEMLANAERVVGEQQDNYKKYLQDKQAHDALVEEMTRPAGAQAPAPDVSTLAAQSALQPKPGASVTLPPIDNAQSVQQARDQNAAAQNQRGTPESGNQNQARADLLQEAFQSGEKNVRGVFQQLLKASYPKDKTAWAPSIDEVRQIIQHVQNRRNLDLKANTDKAADEAMQGAVEEAAPPPETQDTTLGVPEKKPAEPQKPAAPKVAAPAPAQGELAVTRPQGRSPDKRRAKEVAAREAALAPRPEEPVDLRGQGDLFAELTAAEKKATEVVVRQKAEGKVADAAHTRLDELVAARPDIKPETVAAVSRAIKDRKFQQAHKMMDKEALRPQEPARGAEEPARAEEPLAPLAPDRISDDAVARDEGFNKYTTDQLQKMQDDFRASNYDRSTLPEGMKPLDLHEELATRKALEPKPDYAGTFPRERLEGKIADKVESGDIDGQTARQMLQDIKSNDPSKIRRIEDEVFAKRRPDDLARKEAEPNPIGPNVDQQSDITRVQADVNEATRDWKNAPDVQVFHGDTAPSTPAEKYARDRDRAEGGNGDAAGYAFTDPETNRPTVLINAKHHATKEATLATLYHEALGHQGIRQAFGKGLNGLFRDIYNTTPEFKAEVDRRVADFKQRGIERHDARYHAEEVFAEASERGTLKRSVFERVKAYVQNFARRIGLRKSAYSPAELRAILAKAHEAVEQGPPPSRRTVPGDLARRDPNRPDDRTPAQKIRDRATKLGLQDTPATSLAISINQRGREFLQGMMFGRDLVDYLKPLLPSYGDYHTKLQEKQQIVNDYTRKVDQMMVDANKLGTEKSLQMSAYMKDATLSEKWGYQPTWLTQRLPDGTVKPKMVQVDPEQKRKHDAFVASNPEGAALADEFFKQGFESREALREAVRVEREADTADALKTARNSLERREIERQKVRAAKLFDAKVPSLPGPYIPLARFGSYLSIGKSKEYLAAEADKTPAGREALENLRSDPNHYYVAMHDWMGQAEADAQQIKKDFGFDHVESTAKAEFYKGVNEAPYLQMQKLKQMVADQLGQNDQFDRPTVDHINTLLRDLYYSSLAEGSARKHDLRRERVAGVKDEDILRGIASKTRADANFLASITHNNEMLRHMQAMREEAAAQGSNRNERQTALNEVVARHAQGMQYDPTPLQDKATGIASFWYLATSPRYYIQNGLQTAMVTAPVLAGKHGFGRAWGHILGAYKDFNGIVNSRDFWNGKFDIDQLKISADEKNFLEGQRKTGLLDIGLNYDMGYWEGGNSRPGKYIQNMTHWLRTKSQQVEVLNRVTAGLSAYRLGREDGMTHEKASGYAQDIIAQTHGDYTRTNAPRYLNMLPKVMTQFRKYQMIQVSLLARQAYNAFNAGSPAERWAARRTLAHLFGQTALVTGAFGLPMAQGAAYALSAAFGPDDQPADGEKFLRDAIGDKGIADAILKGIPTAAGLDLSANLGMGTAASILPYTDIDLTSREGIGNAAVGLLGPAAGLAQNMADSLGYLKQGAYQKGIETAMPSGLRALMRAYRTGAEGMTNKQGDLLLKPDEINFFDTALTAAGFTTTQVADARRTQQVTREYDQYFKDRTTALKYSYTQAAKDGDAEALTDLRDQWNKLQASKKGVGFKPAPLGELLTSPVKQERREKAAQAGVATTRSNARFVAQSLAE